MGKRRISSLAESSDDNYCASPPPSKGITTIRNPVKKKPRIIASDDDFRDEAETQPRPHTVSIHLINAPGPLRVALLKWYAGVHETRGMPWRKQYDPLLGRDGRAQRAYEVRTCIIRCLHHACVYLCVAGLDIRNNAATDPSCDCDTVL